MWDVVLHIVLVSAERVPGQLGGFLAGDSLVVVPEYFMGCCVDLLDSWMYFMCSWRDFMGSWMGGWKHSYFFTRWVNAYTGRVMLSVLSVAIAVSNYNNYVHLNRNCCKLWQLKIVIFRLSLNFAPILHLISQIGKCVSSWILPRRILLGVSIDKWNTNSRVLYLIIGSAPSPLFGSDCN